jgi:hypothetical protein
MKIFVVFVFLIAANAFRLEPATTLKATTVSGLQGFPHEVGESFGEDKANTLLNLLNTAATLYRDNM